MVRLLSGFGLLCLGVGIAIIFSGGGSGSGAIVSGIITLLGGLTWSLLPVIRVSGDHVEIRPAPLRARRRVLVKDIISIRRQGPKVLEFRFRRREGRPNSLRLGTSTLEPRQLEHFLAWLGRRLQHGDAASFR
jgi:hypothetical protein